MFVSNYEVNIDSKGRVSVPPPFRGVLGGRSRLILWPAIDGNNCLEGSTEEAFNIYQQSILLTSVGNKRRRALINVMASQAHDLKIDDTGRIKLPEKWIALASVEDRVIFAGTFDKFQIWEPVAYQSYETEMMEVAKEEETLEMLEAPYQKVMESLQQNPSSIEGR